MQFTACSNKA